SITDDPYFGHGVTLKVGASLIFDNIFEPEDGLYILQVDIPYQAGINSVTMDVIVNNEVQDRYDPRDGSPSINYQPYKPAIIQLHKGNNTIELKTVQYNCTSSDCTPPF